jgi:hypothetical protein
MDNIIDATASPIDRVLAVDGGSVASDASPPGLAAMFAALEAVNPWTPTNLVVSDAVWERIGPAYDDLGRTLAHPQANRLDKRNAWKRWRQRLHAVKSEMLAAERRSKE